MSQIITCIFWKWHNLSLLTCMHIATQMDLQYFCSQNGTVLGTGVYLGAAEFTVVLSSVLGWHQRVWALQAGEAGISFSGLSAKFWITGAHELLLGKWLSLAIIGKGVLCFMVTICSIKSPSPVSWTLIALLRRPSPYEKREKQWKCLLSKNIHFWRMARGAHVH